MSFNHFFQIADNIRPACKQIVSGTVIDLASAVQEQAPVDTGFMHDAVYYVTPDGESSYGNAEPTKKGSYLLEEAQPENDMQGVVGAAASYSIFVNNGHHTVSGSYVPAQPFFDQGMEQAEEIFNEHAAEFESLIGV